MHLIKSTRHAKITGEFGEHLVLYWLSRKGFECARIDHTGIDLIARNSLSGELMGISVKSRSRAAGTEASHVNIPVSDFSKAEKACQAFACTPYFAVLVDCEDELYVFMLPLAKLKSMLSTGNKVFVWKMTSEDVSRYRVDPEIMMLEFKSVTHLWFPAVQVTLD